MEKYKIKKITNRWGFAHSVYIYEPKDWNGKTFINFHGVPFEFDGKYASATALKDFCEKLYDNNVRSVLIDNSFTIFKKNILRSGNKNFKVNMYDFFKYSLENAKVVTETFQSSKTFLHGGSWGTLLIQSLGKKLLKDKSIFFSNTITYEDQLTKNELIEEPKISYFNKIRLRNNFKLDIGKDVECFFHGEFDHIKSLNKLMSEVESKKIFVIDEADHALVSRKNGETSYNYDLHYENWWKVYNYIFEKIIFS